jgi:TonB family protein
VIVDAKQLKVRHRPPAPAYPPLARLAKVQGVVALRLTLDAKGCVEQADVLEGPPLLRPTAKAFYKQWTFEPVQAEGKPVRAQFEFLMPFRLAESPEGQGDPALSQVVLEVEKADSVRPAPVDLEAITTEATAWLNQLGLAVIGLNQADPSRTLHLKLGIEAFKTREGIYIHQVAERVSLLADRGLEENPPGDPQRIHFVTRVQGQKGETGFQAALMDTLRKSLQELIAPRAPLLMAPPIPPGSVALGKSNPPSGFKAEKPGMPDFDFSQIRIKRQPPVPPYPAYAKARGIQGIVVVLVTIDPTGTPVLVEPMEGPQALLSMAIGYALDWEFEPARVNGVPVDARFRLTMDFKLNTRPQPSPLSIPLVR